jgi:hypothetical protein
MNAFIQRWRVLRRISQVRNAVDEPTFCGSSKRKIPLQQEKLKDLRLFE